MGKRQEVTDAPVFRYLFAHIPLMESLRLKRQLFAREHLIDLNGAEKHRLGMLKKFKLVDKWASLELLGLHLKLFTERVEVGGLETLAEDLKKARIRAGCGCEDRPNSMS